jgi:hypothetical protein
LGYKAIAAPLAERGIPTVPLRPRSKVAFLTEWEEKATTDLAQIEKWDTEYPDANGACVAIGKLGGVWFLELDKPEVVQRIETETGKKIPRTFRVRSSPGRGHFYFKQSEASIACGNIAQGFVKHGDWSARVNRQYVVAPGSLHPKTGLPYEIVSTAEIIEAPQWLIDWLLSQKLDKKTTYVDDGAPIPDGARDSTLASIAGGLRYKGMNQEELEMVLSRINRERCKPPLPISQVQKIAWSISRYPVGPEPTVIISDTSSPSQFAQVEVSEPTEDVKIIPYPEFPIWVIDGTSIGEGLVKPICAQNCRYEEFMFMPAMAMMLNYIGTRVTIKHNPMMKPNLFMVLVGKRGKIIKSTSVQDAIQYLRYCGIVDHFSPNMTNAADKTVIFEVGSPEALGIQMSRINCKNAVLFYDELTTLTNKASIESSSLASKLLTLYESGNFQNLIKSSKESYSLAPNTYCASLIACCTDKNFLAQWSKMSGKSSGLDERFFFLYQPKTFKPLTPMVYVPTILGAIETRKMIDRAIDKKEYAVTDRSTLHDKIEELGNRAELRAEKFALYFAIDRGLDEIDEDCLERAFALVAYEKAVKKFLAPFEGSTKQGGVQLTIINILERRPSGVSYRDLEREMHTIRMGTDLWTSCYKGLIANGWIAETGSGKKGDPKNVILLRASDEGDD